MKALAGPSHSSSRYEHIEHIPSEDKTASPACTTDALEGYLPTPEHTLSLDTSHTSRGGKE